MSSVSNSGKQGDGKAKGKFSAVNINSVYKGRNTNPQKSNAPIKQYGLQSLGKVASGRRAPAPVILPSLKSQTGNNDPNVNLVPPGGAGWGANATASGPGLNGTENRMESPVPGPSPETTHARPDPKAPWGKPGRADPLAPPYMGGQELSAPAGNVSGATGPAGSQLRPQRTWRAPPAASGGPPPSHPSGGPPYGGTPPNNSDSAADSEGAASDPKRPQSLLKNELDEITKDDMVASGWALAHNDELDYSAKIVFSDDEDESAPKRKYAEHKGENHPRSAWSQHAKSAGSSSQRVAAFTMPDLSRPPPFMPPPLLDTPPVPPGPSPPAAASAPVQCPPARPTSQTPPSSQALPVPAATPPVTSTLLIPPGSVIQNSPQEEERQMSEAREAKHQAKNMAVQRARQRKEEEERILQQRQREAADKKLRNLEARLHGKSSPESRQEQPLSESSCIEASRDLDFENMTPEMIQKFKEFLKSENKKQVPKEDVGGTMLSSETNVAPVEQQIASHLPKKMSQSSEEQEPAFAVEGSSTARKEEQKLTTATSKEDAKKVSVSSKRERKPVRASHQEFQEYPEAADDPYMLANYSGSGWTRSRPRGARYANSQGFRTGKGRVYRGSYHGYDSRIHRGRSSTLMDTSKRGSRGRRGGGAPESFYEINHYNEEDAQTVKPEVKDVVGDFNTPDSIAALGDSLQIDEWSHAQDAGTTADNQSSRTKSNELIQQSVTSLPPSASERKDSQGSSRHSNENPWSRSQQESGKDGEEPNESLDRTLTEESQDTLASTHDDTKKASHGSDKVDAGADAKKSGDEKRRKDKDSEKVSKRSARSSKVATQIDQSGWYYDSYYYGNSYEYGYYDDPYYSQQQYYGRHDTRAGRQPFASVAHTVPSSGFNQSRPQALMDLRFNMTPASSRVSSRRARLGSRSRGTRGFPASRNPGAASSRRQNIPKDNASDQDYETASEGVTSDQQDPPNHRDEQRRQTEKRKTRGHVEKDVKPRKNSQKDAIVYRQDKTVLSDPKSVQRAIDQKSQKIPPNGGQNDLKKRHFENIDINNIAGVVTVDNLPEVTDFETEEFGEHGDFVEVMSKKDKKSRKLEEQKRLLEEQKKAEKKAASVRNSEHRQSTARMKKLPPRLAKSMNANRNNQNSADLVLDSSSGKHSKKQTKPVSENFKVEKWNASEGGQATSHALRSSSTSDHSSNKKIASQAGAGDTPLAKKIDPIGTPSSMSVPKAQNVVTTAAKSENSSIETRDSGIETSGDMHSQQSSNRSTPSAPYTESQADKCLSSNADIDHSSPKSGPLMLESLNKVEEEGIPSFLPRGNVGGDEQLIPNLGELRLTETIEDQNAVAVSNSGPFNNSNIAALWGSESQQNTHADNAFSDRAPSASSQHKPDIPADSTQIMEDSDNPQQYLAHQNNKMKFSGNTFLSSSGTPSLLGACPSVTSQLTQHNSLFNLTSSSFGYNYQQPDMFNYSAPFISQGFSQGGPAAATSDIFKHHTQQAVPGQGHMQSPSNKLVAGLTQPGNPVGKPQQLQQSFAQGHHGLMPSFDHSGTGGANLFTSANMMQRTGAGSHPFFGQPAGNAYSAIGFGNTGFGHSINPQLGSATTHSSSLLVNPSMAQANNKQPTPQPLPRQQSINQQSHQQHLFGPPGGNAPGSAGSGGPPTFYGQGPFGMFPPQGKPQQPATQFPMSQPLHAGGMRSEGLAGDLNSLLSHNFAGTFAAPAMPQCMDVLNHGGGTTCNYSPLPPQQQQMPSGNKMEVSSLTSRMGSTTPGSQRPHSADSSDYKSSSYAPSGNGGSKQNLESGQQSNRQSSTRGGSSRGNRAGKRRGGSPQAEQSTPGVNRGGYNTPQFSSATAFMSQLPLNVLQPMMMQMRGGPSHRHPYPSNARGRGGGETKRGGREPSSQD